MAWKRCQHRPKPYHKNRRTHNKSCWRHPLVVFTLSFLALGSLRFRKRTGKAVSLALEKQRRKQQQQQHNNKMSKQQSDISSLHFEKVQEGSFRNKAFQRYKVTRSSDQETPVSLREWASILQTDTASVDAWNDLLATAATNYKAFYWECRPTTSKSNQDMEFVLVNAPELYTYARKRPDRKAFAEHFHPSSEVATFGNLGGDSILIAPATFNGDTASSDLAIFCQSATPARQRSFWKAVGAAVEQRYKKGKPFWVSSSGMGVAWLHVRLDDRPKYYQYQPYKQELPGGDSNILTHSTDDH